MTGHSAGIVNLALMTRTGSQRPGASVTRNSRSRAPWFEKFISYFTVIQSTGVGADLRDNGIRCERSHRLACQAGQSRRDHHA
jgi:hypothetical protein